MYGFKKVLIIGIPSLIVVVALVLVTVFAIVPTSKYNEAVKLYNEGKYEEATIILKTLGDYKESKKMISDYESGVVKQIDTEGTAGPDGTAGPGETQDSSEPTPLPTATPIPTATPSPTPLPTVAPDIETNDSVMFGKYEQDNAAENGAEEIEWIVLEKEEDRLLLVSKYVLDVKQFNSFYANAVWENCTLSKWLNGEFYRNAFTEEEKAVILTTAVENVAPEGFETEHTTQNKVFLLSESELVKYFRDENSRMCLPTEYAIANGVYTYAEYKVDGRAACWWWLRSTGLAENCIMRVGSGGGVSEEGYGVTSDDIGVRPAIWISTETN